MQCNAIQYQFPSYVVFVINFIDSMLRVFKFWNLATVSWTYMYSEDSAGSGLVALL